jgi:putative membrane protein
MIRTILFAAFLAGAAAASPGVLAGSRDGAPAANPVAPTKEDRSFFDDAAQGGMLEVKLGEHVAKNGINDEVKRFAQRMVTDHTKVNSDLATAGQQVGLSMPQELDKKHKGDLDKLTAMVGDKLDREYVDRMIKDHENDVKLYEKQSKDGKSPALKQFATNALPTLKEHLAAVRDIHDHLKK